MSSVIVLSLLIVATFVVLCYMFSEARIELDSPTIAAMEAHAQAVGEIPETGKEERKAPSAKDERHDTSPLPLAAGDETPVSEGLPPVSLMDYEYRELLEEGGENFVLPQWMVNFFSSSDICHTLDRSDNVLLVVKLNDLSNADSGGIDMLAECDMNTQTVAFKLCLGDGAAAESFTTKFYMYERGDTFELNRLVRQNDLRIDVLTRAADYTLEYAGTVRTKIPRDVLMQLKDALMKIS